MDVWCMCQIHDFDMARFLVDSEIVEVYTKGDCKVDPAIAEAGTSRAHGSL